MEQWSANFTITSVGLLKTRVVLAKNRLSVLKGEVGRGYSPNLIKTLKVTGVSPCPAFTPRALLMIFIELHCSSWKKRSYYSSRIPASADGLVSGELRTSRPGTVLSSRLMFCNIYYER